MSTKGAYFDQDGFLVNDAGDVLAYVVAGGSIPDDRCEVTKPAALVWLSHDGTRRVLGGDVTGRVRAVADGNGFVVGALDHPCAPNAGGHDAPGAYMVTATGTTVHIRWPAGAEGRRTRRICEYWPVDERCVFSAVDATVHLRPAAPRSPNGHRTRRVTGGVLIERSLGNRQMWWSTDDGKTWHHRVTPLASWKGPDGRGPDYINTVAYDRTMVLGFQTDAGVDFSLDSGLTWTVRRLPTVMPGDLHGPLREVYITASGILLGLAPTPNGRGEQLVRSTDARWSHLEATPIRATRIPIWVMVHGDTVNVTNPNVVDLTEPSPWWISTDAGAHWRRNDLIPQSTR